jgi:hypothetical protein
VTLLGEVRRDVLAGLAAAAGKKDAHVPSYPEGANRLPPTT